MPAGLACESSTSHCSFIRLEYSPRLRGSWRFRLSRPNYDLWIQGASIWVVISTWVMPPLSRNPGQAVRIQTGTQ